MTSNRQLSKQAPQELCFPSKVLPLLNIQLTTNNTAYYYLQVIRARC
jgi:hypothetical protein